MRGKAALPLHLCHLEGAPEFEEGVSAKEGSDEDAVFLEDPSHLLEKPGKVVDPVGAQTRCHQVDAFVIKRQPVIIPLSSFPSRTS